MKPSSVLWLLFIVRLTGLFCILIFLQHDYKCVLPTVAQQVHVHDWYTLRMVIIFQAWIDSWWQSKWWKCRVFFSFAGCYLAVAAVRLGSWQFYQRTLSCSNEQIALRLVEADVVHRMTSATSNVNCLLQVCLFRQKGDVNVMTGCLLGKHEVPSAQEWAISVIFIVSFVRHSAPRTLNAVQ